VAITAAAIKERIRLLDRLVMNLAREADAVYALDEARIVLVAAIQRLEEER
jgi:hypothetical protein